MSAARRHASIDAAASPTRHVSRHAALSCPTSARAASATRSSSATALTSVKSVSHAARPAMVGSAAACSSAVASAAPRRSCKPGLSALTYSRRRNISDVASTGVPSPSASLTRTASASSSAVLSASTRCNYNQRMIVVRYVTLAALVLWLGAMLASRFGDVLREFPLLGPSCGAVVIVGLFATKFMGPPPHSFAARVGIVFVMLLIALAAAARLSGAATPAMMVVNIGLGFLLLSWYARE